VLTAAHCVGANVLVYKLPDQFQVILGDHDRLASEASEQTRNVVQVVVHPNWNNATKDNDIALLKLDSPVIVNERVKSVSLIASPADDTLVAPDIPAIVTGWGDTTDGGELAVVLQKVQIPIVSNATCDSAMNATITDNMLCAGNVEGGQDSCQGDSGGPLVVPDGSGEWKLAGVVSFGEGCAQPGKYGVYARVSRYVSWIQQYIGSADGPAPLRNANFDLGRNGDWLENSTNSFPLVTDASLPITPRSGSYLAWLGGDNNETSIIRQTVSLNERATNLTLYYQVLSSEATCVTGDFGAVRINGIIQPSSLTLCPITVTSDWTQAFFDISSYAGRTIDIDVGVSTDAVSPSSMFVDDILIGTASSPLLSITNFTPPTGKADTVITVNGSNFLDVTEVLFNGVAASFAVQSDSVLNATVPAGASTGPITIKTAYSTTISSETFTILQPLTVGKDGNGSGSVASNPGGINCGADCTEDYLLGTSVTLTAQPAADSLFTGWSGACNSTNATCELAIDAAKSVTATFALKTFAVNVTKSGDGSGTITSEPAGISCGADCTDNYAIGTVITLAAQSDNDSVFAGWGGACVGEQLTCEITVSEVTAVSAAFASNNLRVYLPLIKP
jgi:hypothetical protein